MCSNLLSTRLLKSPQRRLTEIDHGVSERHLQAYLNEFTFRFNRRLESVHRAFRSLLGIASDAKAPDLSAQLYSGDLQLPYI